MKKIFSILALTALCVNAAYAAEYYIDGWVFAADGSSGTASTENSFSTMHAYRTGINGQLGVLNPPGRVSPLAGSNQAAFYVADVGSSNWAGTAAAEGQTITAVFEVYEPLFGWAGVSYIACTRAVITGSDAVNLQTDISSVQLRAIPTPQLDSLTANQAVLSLIGINENYIDSYNLYRSTTPSGTYAFVALVPQNRGNAIQLADNTVLSGQDYYYKWGVNFIWGGGGGAPAYYTSAAMSQASGPVLAPTISETATGTNTPTVTATRTGTVTITDTPSSTLTATKTTTPTMTTTLTVTGTSTDTATVTITATITATTTNTITPTVTETAVNTATRTVTPVFTGTATATAVIAPPVDQEPAAYPQPAKNSITFSYKLKVSSAVKIYVYNLM